MSAEPQQDVAAQAPPQPVDLDEGPVVVVVDGVRYEEIDGNLYERGPVAAAGPPATAVVGIEQPWRQPNDATVTRTERVADVVGIGGEGATVVDAVGRGAYRYPGQQAVRPWLSDETFSKVVAPLKGSRNSVLRSALRLRCDLRTMLCDFVAILVFSAVAVVMFVPALPLMALAIAVDAVINLLSALPCALLLCGAFLAAPRFGPKIKLLSILLLPLTVLLALLLVAIFELPVAVLVCLGFSFMLVFSSEGALVSAWLRAAAETADLCFTAPRIHAAVWTKVAQLRLPLGANEKPYDIPVWEVMGKAVFALAGGIAGLLVLLLPCIAASPIAFFACYRLFFRGLGELGPVAVCIASPLLLVAFALAGPLALAAWVVALPLAGLYAGLQAVVKDDGAGLLSAWSDYIGGILTVACKDSIQLLLTGR